MHLENYRKLVPVATIVYLLSRHLVALNVVITTLLPREREVFSHDSDHFSFTTHPSNINILGKQTGWIRTSSEHINIPTFKKPSLILPLLNKMVESILLISASSFWVGTDAPMFGSHYNNGAACFWAKQPVSATGSSIQALFLGSPFFAKYIQ